MKSSPGASKPRERLAAERGAAGGFRAPAWLERAALFALLMVLAMRPLLSESYESSEGLFADYVRGVNITSPATTAGFDVVIWLAALITALAAWIDGRRHAGPASGAGTQAAGNNARIGRTGLRWTGLEPGWIFLLVAAVISTITTVGNTRLALNASTDWLTGVALIMVLANLCRNRVRIALVLAVITATGVTAGAKSVMQTTIEYRDTLKEYEQNKAQLWGDVPPDDPRVLLYERRLRANEASGFLAHPNAQGSLMLLCGFAAIAAGGLTGAHWARWALYAAGGGLFASILLTGSRGALLAAGAGLVLMAVLHALEPVLRRRWRMALVGGWAAVLAGGLGVTAFGLIRDGLPGASLAFRWNYWQVTAEIVREHLWTGLGALNFDQAYLLHKPIEFPEEIRDPHNFVLSILAQWGLLGAAGLGLTLVGASFVAIRRWAETPRPALPGPSPEDRQILLHGWMPAVVVGYGLVRLWLLRGLMDTPGGRATIFIDLAQYGLIWAGTFAAVAAAGLTLGRPGRLDYRLAALCGVAAFLLHNTIDFSLFVPGTLTAFAGLSGVLLAGVAEPARDAAEIGKGDRKTGRQVRFPSPVAVGLAGGGLLATMLLVFVPVSRSAAELAKARALPLPAAERYYRAAAKADPLDPVPPAEMVERYLQQPRPDRIDDMITILNEAIDRDLHRIGLYRLRTRIYDLRYRLTGSERDLRSAIASARRVAALYPQSPDEHLGLATMLAQAAMAIDSERWHEEAQAEYTRALALDAARPGTDEVRKWSPRRRAEVEAAMNALAQRPAPADTQPDSATISP